MVALTDGVGGLPNAQNPHAMEQNFAYMMRRLRQQRGMSQTALAEALEEYGFKLDGTAITRMEKAVLPGATSRAIRLSEADAIARVLGSTVQRMIAPAAASIDALRMLEEQKARAENQIRDNTNLITEIDELMGAIREQMERAGVTDGEHSEAPER